MKSLPLPKKSRACRNFFGRSLKKTNINSCLTLHRHNFIHFAGIAPEGITVVAQNIQFAFGILPKTDDIKIETIRMGRRCESFHAPFAIAALASGEKHSGGLGPKT